tara:strand:+ start:594 stop:872 length:279 start_codon:yes stop_codon:yes gene_type:complete
MTSPRPPVFENGAHSAPTMTMFRRSSATTRSDDVRDLFDVPARVGATRGAASRARLAAFARNDIDDARFGSAIAAKFEAMEAMAATGRALEE